MCRRSALDQPKAGSGDHAVMREALGQQFPIIGALLVAGFAGA
jgi:hypothetical protein